MGPLPFVDEHARDVAAPPEATWDALVAALPRAFGGASASRYARWVGADPAAPEGAFPGAASALPGFRVREAAPPRALALEGRHRFSDYALTFLLEPLEDGARTRLRAQTHAAFPGAAGRLYRVAVIGSRGHVLLLRRLMASVARRAERPAPRTSR